MYAFAIKGLTNTLRVKPEALLQIHLHISLSFSFFRFLTDLLINASEITDIQVNDFAI